MSEVRLLTLGVPFATAEDIFFFFFFFFFNGERGLTFLVNCLPSGPLYEMPSLVFCKMQLVLSAM